MNPAQARDADDLRAFKGHVNRGQQAGFQTGSNPMNGFTEAFNARIPRQTVGVESRRFDLDLSSTVRNIQLGSKLFEQANAVNINVGGANRSFSAGDHVTAAEFVAIQQMLAQNQQTIDVSAQGTASGGSFSLNQPNGTRINDLVVPQSVSAVNYFSSNRSVNLSGDLTNMGTILGVSTNGKVRSGVISADDINNSGTISTDLSNSFLSDLRGTVKNVDLTLVAENSLNNSGTISASGALNVATVNGALSNSGSISGQSGNVSVFTGNGSLTNSGSIAALNGNLNIDASRVATDLNINGAGGTFSASQDINVRDLSYTDANNTTLLGGTYLSDNLNVTGGGGTITTYVDEISGDLNTSGLAAHVTTNSGTLVLGDNCLTGDPTFANSGGDIIINGGVIARQDITILASGNIIATGNAFISTANSTGQVNTPSTNVTLVAGATITFTGGATSTPSVPNPGLAIPAGSTASVDFTTGGGGNIDFSGSKYLGWLIDTSSHLVNDNNQQQNGGDVILAAVSTNTDNGFIIFPEARPAINTSSAYGNSGDVSIIAGNTSAVVKTPAIKMGIINTAANPVSGNNSGNVLFYAAQPESTTGAPIVFNDTGAVQGAVNFELDIADLTFTGSSIQFGGAVFAADGDITAVTNTAGLGGLLQKGSGRLQGDVVTLRAGTGGIGSGSSKKSTRLLTEANVLLMNSASNIFINNLGSVNIGNGGAPGALAGNLGIIDISTTADGDGNGAIAVPNDGQVQASIGTLSVINLTSSSARGGAGNISTANNAQLIATTVNLATVNEADGVKGLGYGNIGTNSGAQSINVIAQFVSANTQGDVFIHSNGGAITILDSSAGNGQDFDVRTTPVGANGSGAIFIGGTIASAFGRIGNLLLASSEAGAGLGGIFPAGTLVADSIELRDDDNLGNAGQGIGSIGSLDSPIVVETSNLDVRTTGNDIFIQNLIKTGMELERVNTNADRSVNFNLESASTVNITGDVFTAFSTTITVTGAGHILLNSDIDVNGNTPTVSLTTGTGSITGDGTIAFNGTGAFNVIFTTNGGSVGTDVQPISTEATIITSNATGYTNIYNEVNTAVSLVSALSKSQFSLAADGTINVDAPILTATGIRLHTTGNGDLINLNQSIGSAKATNYVEVMTEGDGDITQAGLAFASAKILVALSTGGGDIGTTTINPIKVATPGLAANTAGGGSVFLSASPSKKVPLTLFNSSAELDFNLFAQSSVLLNNIQTVDGSILVQTTTGTLSTNTNAIIQVAEAGNRTNNPETITLRNDGTKKSGIVIGAGTTIATFVDNADKPAVGAGDITITIGAPVQVAGTAPGNVTQNTTGGGQIFFGTNGITALAPNNTLNALDADITFSTGTLPATAITLGGGVTITADPPSTTAVRTTLPTSVLEISGAGLSPRVTPVQDSLFPQVTPATSSTQLTSATATALPATSQLAASQLEASSRSAFLNDFSNLFTAQAAEQNALNLAALSQPGWISETELVNGEIPAALIHDGETEIVGDADARADFEGTVQLNSNRSTSRPQTSLRRGTAVFAPSVDTVIDTAVGQIKIGAKSLALVMAFADGVAVYDIDDVRKGAIEVTAGGNSIKLSPGQHVFITRSDADSFDQINPAQVIGYRGITSKNLGSGLKAFSAEFCVPHAIHAVKPLKSIVQSKHPQSKKVADHLLKTTAAIMQLRGGAEFQQVFRPRKTAWMN